MWKKIYRQYPIDRFVVDFCCPKAALVIEVDGEIHRAQAAADHERDDLLASLGFRVCRFTNAQVMCQTELVLRQIEDALLAPIDAHGNPSPNLENDL